MPQPVEKPSQLEFPKSPEPVEIKPEDKPADLAPEVSLAQKPDQKRIEQLYMNLVNKRKQDAPEQTSEINDEEVALLLEFAQSLQEEVQQQEITRELEVLKQKVDEKYAKQNVFVDKPLEAAEEEDKEL